MIGRDGSPPSDLPLSLALSLALGLAAVLGWPLAATVLSAFSSESNSRGGGLIDAAAFVDRQGAAAGPTIQTLRVVLGALLIALPIGVFLAVLLFKTDSMGRKGLAGLLAASLFLPMPLHATGWLGSYGNVGRYQALGGEQPILCGWPGAAWVHAMACVPWVALLVGIALRAVEPELEESALLDRPGGWVMLRVSLRRSVGAVAASALAVAVLTAGDMTVTDLLQVRTYAEEAYVQYGLGRSPAEVARVALPPTLVLGVLVCLGAVAVARFDRGRVATARGNWVLRLGRARVLAGLVSGLLVLLVIGLPLYGLVWRAGRVSGTLFQQEGARWSVSGLAATLGLAAQEVLGPLATSAFWASIASVFSVAIAWGLAWACRSGRTHFWPMLTIVSCALMLATPGPVAGMALVLAYRDFPLVYDTPAIVLLGHMLRTLPFALLVVWPAVHALPDAFLEAARVDGLSRWQVIRRVGLPLTAGASLAAWGVAFVLALGELPVTNLVYPPGVTLLSVVVWGLLHTGVESHLAGVGLILMSIHGAIGLVVAVGLGRVLQSRSG